MRTMLVACGLAAVSSVAAFQKPWFCHDLDCPEFTQLPNITVGGQTVEVRRYTAKQLWTSTVVADTKLTEADGTGFKRLFDYISGDNVAKAKVEMTAPVRSLVTPSQGPFCASNFTVSFYVPYKYQPALTQGASAPPKPSASDVATAEDTEALTVAVVGFGGFIQDDEVVQQAAGLIELLTKAGRPFVDEQWYYAGYDSPFRIVNRHNEVWVQLK